MKKYIIALDQGTTSSKALLFDKDCRLLFKKQQEITQYYPKPGWVEHDPTELFQSSVNVIDALIKESGIDIKEVAALGITNQRETSVIWDRYTGKPVYNAIVWQCRRSADICEKIKQTDLFSYIRLNTGLITDAYFSATKIKWLFDNVEGVEERAQKGDLMFGTVDSWLLYNFTKGKHMTDSTNASRTMLFNLRTLSWDDRLLKEFNIPKSMLPDVLPSGSVFGETDLFGYPLVIASMAGDQQASLFGQACFEMGEMKNTYGTGCFLLVNTGEEMCLSNRGMITTLASDIGAINRYAIEGSVFTGGSVVQWLRDELDIIETSTQSEEYALKVNDSNGVVFVPAFTGLGAPHWDMNARGTIYGLTRGSNKYHIVRAALESIAYQCWDVIDSIFGDVGLHPSELKVDGGASNNGFLMQFQSDITNMEIVRPEMTETTGFGAATLAGLTVGFYESKNEIRDKYRINKRFVPNIDEVRRLELLDRWKHSVLNVTDSYRKFNKLC